MGFRLRITEGKGQGREFYFRRDTVKIGRLPDNDLVLYDASVSRHHCQILRSGKGFKVRDAGSANGILINDVPIVESPISHGDRLQIGPVTFEFCEGAPGRTGPAAPVPRHDDTIASFAWTQAQVGDRPRVQVRPSASRAPSDNATAGLTETGTFAVYRPPRRLRRGVVLGGVAVVVTALLGVGLALWRRPPVDRSREVFVVGPESAARSYGEGKVQVYTPDRVSFAFVFSGGRTTVTYAAGGIEAANEVEILVNGQSIGFVPPVPGKWQSGLRLLLPRQHLSPGKNILTFDNRLTPLATERWGIAEVRVEEEALPEPDVARAQQYLDLARAAFEARTVAPHNLARAVQHYQEGRRYLEAAAAPPPLLAELDAGLGAAERELQNVYDSHLFAAQKAERFGDRDQAVESLRELLRYFPDTDDRRHREVKDRLQALLGPEQALPEEG